MVGPTDISGHCPRVFLFQPSSATVERVFEETLTFHPVNKVLTEISVMLEYNLVHFVSFYAHT